MLGIHTEGTSWEHNLEHYLKSFAEGLGEGLGKDTIVTGVLGVGQICIGSARGLGKTVTEVPRRWTELSETTWILFSDPRPHLQTQCAARLCVIA